jgi:hypothetical protein
MSKVVVKSHSKSLFNLSQSKGWTEEENIIFKKALIKFGIGSWTTIVFFIFLKILGKVKTF